MTPSPVTSDADRSGTIWRAVEEQEFRTRLHNELQVVRAALDELVRAMERYESEAESDAPYEHIQMMQRARDALAGCVQDKRTCESCEYWDGPRDENARASNAAEYGGDGTGPFQCNGLDSGDNVADDVWTVASFSCANWGQADG